MSSIKRLLHYGLFYKRTIFLAFAMLLVSVLADLTGPMIAKNLIDQHIVGIATTFYQTKGQEADAVKYQGRWFKRGTYFLPHEKRGQPITLVSANQTLYELSGKLPANVSDEHVSGNMLTFLRGKQQVAVQVHSLTNKQIFTFYQPEVPKMLVLASFYFGLIVLSAIFTYGQRFLLQISANRILQRMRTDVFGQIARLPIRYFDSIPAGKIVSRITNDTEAIREFYVTIAANVLSSSVTMVGIYIALFLLNRQLALICLLLLPILALWVVLYRHYAVSVNHRIRILLSDINAMINETLQGISIIRAFHRQERTIKEFEELNETFFKEQIRLLSVNAASGWNLVGVLRGLFFVVFIAYFSFRYFHLSGMIQFGVLYAFVDYLNRLFQPVVQLVNQLSGIEQAKVAATRVFELLDEQGEDVAEGVRTRYQGHVQFDDVYFSYDGENDVLRGISFEARPSQTVALVGHTGSGKSSVMNLLFRFYDPQSGTIKIDGEQSTSIPSQYLRQHMGIVLQDPFLFTGTIASNVSLDDPSISRGQVEKALHDIGADRLFAKLERGIDEPVLENGSTLSAGQRQLISFARALAFDPAILVLDEATSSIDTETESVIQQALDVLKKGRTTFIIAHRLSTIRRADLILVLDHGMIVERGTHEQLLAKGGKYSTMVQLQSGTLSA